MTCKVIECKIDRSSLSQTTIEQLHSIFIEGKWLYNAILASDEIGKFDTKTKVVPVKVLGEIENRKLENISSQMKQGIQSRMFSSLSSLKALKEKGHKIGSLRFKREIKCIPLKQHGNTFVIIKSQNRIKIQGIKKPLKVYGLKQLPSNCEIGNANLIRNGKDYFVKITVFVKKGKLQIPNKSVGIDFGCSTQLTLSNGEKIKYQVPVSDRIKKLDQAISRSRKKSKANTRNRYKLFLKREKAYRELTNKRNEIRNQIVNKLVKNYRVIVFQDESLNAWKASGHGKSIQFSAIGGIISALQRKAVTPVQLEKWYPSTQLCSRCGNKHKMKMWERTYACKSCGATFDRDINAAINIEREGLKRIEIPRESREFKPVEIRTSSAVLETKQPKVQSAKQETQPSLVVG